MDVQVRFEEKNATIRYVPAKVALEKILQRYNDTPFRVTPSSDIVTLFHTPHATLRAWTVRMTANEPADSAASQAAPSPAVDQPPPAIRLLLSVEAANNATLVDTRASLADPPASELRLVAEFQEAEKAKDEESQATDQSAETAAQRQYAAQLRQTTTSMPRELLIPVSVKLIAADQEGTRHESDCTLDVVLRSPPPPAAAVSSTTGVTLIDGALELRLGHLCDQRGCLHHFHQSLSQIPGLGAVQAAPSLEAPRATVFLRAQEPLDLWKLRETLRGASIEVRDMRPRDLADFSMRVDLPRVAFDDHHEAEQCLTCRDATQQLLQQLTWVADAELAGGGFHFSSRTSEVNLAELLDALQHAGIAPSAVWLIPAGVPMPKASQPVTLATAEASPSQPSHAHAHADADGACCSFQPLVEIEFPHAGFEGRVISHALANLRWTGHRQFTHDAPATIQATIADRQYGGVSSLLKAIQSGGELPAAIRLREFGDIRIQLKFAHICGEVEYSKPPERKKKDNQETKDGGQAKEPPKEDKEEKPFVPKPLRPDVSSNGRKAIEAALQNVSWIRDGVFQDYHTKPEFTSVTDMTIALAVNGEDVVRLDELITALRDAGFPPTSVIVSRRFSGIPFASPLPGQMQLTAAQGELRSTASLRQPERPLVVAFVSLKCKRDKYKDHQPDAKLYERFGQTIGKYKDRVDFVAVSANPDDTFEEVTKFWSETGLAVELLRDQDGTLRSALNAQETPAPHLYVFDADGLLRYAGDAHNHWDKPDQAHDDYLAAALDLVLAKEFQANGAVHYKSAVCNCSDPKCKCPKCGCGPSCRCTIGH